jgi:hypothetical protein
MKLPAIPFCYLSEGLKERFHAFFPDTPCRQRELLVKFMNEHPPGEWAAEIHDVLLIWERDVASCILLAIEHVHPVH